MVAPRRFLMGVVVTESEVISLVREAVDRAGSMRKLASEWGVSPPMISDLLGGRRGPGPKILRHLGLKRIKSVSYVKDNRNHP